MIGYGRNFKYYDYTDYGYYETLKSVSDEVENFTDSDFPLVSQDYITTSKSRNLGTKIDDIHLNTRPLSSLIQLEALIRYDKDIKLGSIVQVVLPAQEIPDQVSRVVIDTLSSYWMVSKIVHYVDDVSNDYFMKLMLTRSGVDLKSSDKLVSGS